MTVKNFILILCSAVFFLAVGYTFGLSVQKLNQNSLGKFNSIILPQELLSYDIVQAKDVQLASPSAKFLVVGFQPKSFPDKTNRSFLEFFQRTGANLTPVYKFAPVLPDPEAPALTFEDMWFIGQSANTLVTSWAQIGADYFGSYPIVFNFANGVFKAIPFYEGNIADDPQLKSSTWTSPDIEVKNEFDQVNSVKTILTQGITVEDNEISLKFYSDSNCHACEHTYIYLKYPLEK